VTEILVLALCHFAIAPLPLVVMVVAATLGIGSLVVCLVLLGTFCSQKAVGEILALKHNQHRLRRLGLKWFGCGLLPGGGVPP
jgi:hypothetical protein